MVKDVLKRDTLGWVCYENSVYEIFCHVWYGYWGWVFEGVGFYVLVGLFNCVVFKWGLAEEESVHYDADWPDIDLVGMTIFLEDLWSDVVWRSTYCFFDLALLFNSGW